MPDPALSAALREAYASAPAEEVARRGAGIDLGDPGFWRAGIRNLGPELERFEALSPDDLTNI